MVTRLTKSRYSGTIFYDSASDIGSNRHKRGIAAHIHYSSHLEIAIVETEERNFKTLLGTIYQERKKKLCKIKRGKYFVTFINVAM